jgi:hypothetical protein
MADFQVSRIMNAKTMLDDAIQCTGPRSRDVQFKLTTTINEKEMTSNGIHIGHSRSQHGGFNQGIDFVSNHRGWAHLDNGTLLL